MMIEAIQNGVRSWSTHLNAQTALENFALNKVQQQKRVGYQLLYRLAAYWLPLSKAVMELILIGSFLLIILLVFFPFGMSVLKNYAMTFIWLQLWAPLFAFCNFILSFYAPTFLGSSTLLPDGSHGITLSTYSLLDQMNADLGTMGGFFAALTPLLAAGIFKGLMSVFVQASNYIGGAIQSFAFSAAGEAVTGNLSMGNTQMNNHSSWNTNTNHYDENARVSSGILNYQLDGGSQVSITPEGETILQTQSGISNLPVRISLSESLRQSFSEMADHSWSTGLRYTHSQSESYAAGFRKIYESGISQSLSESSSTSHAITQSDGYSTAVRDVRQLVERFAHDHHISYAHAARILGTVYGDIHASESFNTKDHLGGKVINTISGFSFNQGATIGARGEVSRSQDTQESELYQQGQSFMKEHDLQHSVDNAIRGMKENSYRKSAEGSNRESDSIMSHFEQGDRYGIDAMNSFEQAESYRRQENLIKDEGVSIDTQASQAFVNWLSKEPNPNDHTKHIDVATMENLMVNQPELIKAYASQFVKEQEQQYIDHFKNEHSEHLIQTDYQKHDAQIEGREHINKTRQMYDQKIVHQALQTDTGQVKENAVISSENLMHQAKGEIIDGKNREGQNQEKFSEGFKQNNNEGKN